MQSHCSHLVTCSRGDCVDSVLVELKYNCNTGWILLPFSLVFPLRRSDSSGWPWHCVVRRVVTNEAAKRYLRHHKGSGRSPSGSEGLPCCSPRWRPAHFATCLHLGTKEWDHCRFCVKMLFFCTTLHYVDRKHKIHGSDQERAGFEQQVHIKCNINYQISVESQSLSPDDNISKWLNN